MSIKIKSTVNKDKIALLKAQGQKLGFLIGSSKLSQDTKLELVELLRVMNLEQIERLIRIFEAKYVNEETQDIDKDFENKLGQLIQSAQKKKDRMKEEVDHSFNNFKAGLNL